MDYIVKPFAKEEVLARVRAHVLLFRLRRELQRKNEELQTEISRRKAAERDVEKAQEALDAAGERLSFLSKQEERRWGIPGFVGKSQTVNSILIQIKRLQDTESITALITGESGTGKELIARAIHFGSARSRGPFIPLNCAAIPKDLAESMLFGHMKGAFSGATRSAKGYFEMANGGTLFMDEIAELPLELQAKFLRVLDEHGFIPIGGTEHHAVVVRILAATNRDLRLQVQRGLFREDLFFRLARYTLEVPPLRERREDIPLLTQHFLEMFSTEMSKPCLSISPEAMSRIQEYSFRGNIRELKNLLERALIECQGNVILPEHLHFLQIPESVCERSAPMAHGMHALKATGGESAETRLEEEAILEYIRTHGSATNAECRELLRTDIDRAYYLLNKLQKAGLLKRVGEHRGARYYPPSDESSSS